MLVQAAERPSRSDAGIHDKETGGDSSRRDVSGALKRVRRRGLRTTVGGLSWSPRRSTTRFAFVDFRRAHARLSCLESSATSPNGGRGAEVRRADPGAFESSPFASISRGRARSASRRLRERCLRNRKPGRGRVRRVTRWAGIPAVSRSRAGRLRAGVSRQELHSHEAGVGVNHAAPLMRETASSLRMGRSANARTPKLLKPSVA